MMAMFGAKPIVFDPNDPANARPDPTQGWMPPPPPAPLPVPVGSGMAVNTQPQQLTDPTLNAPIPKPSAWGQGGSAWSTIGGIGDVFAALGGKGTPYHDSQLSDQKLALEGIYKQQQLGLEALKARQSGQTALQKTREYLLSIGRPDLAASYTAAEANPQTLGTNPATGGLQFYPKGGMPGMNAGTAQPKTQAEYDALPKGTTYLDDDGSVKVKS